MSSYCFLNLEMMLVLVLILLCSLRDDVGTYCAHLDMLSYCYAHLEMTSVWICCHIYDHLYMSFLAKV